MARCSAWERGSIGRAPSVSARIRRLTHWMSARNSRAYQSPRGRRRSRSGIAVSAASWTVETGRPAAGATVGSDSVGTVCWNWCRRQRRTRPGVIGGSSNVFEGKPLKGARTPPEESLTRIVMGVAGAKGSYRGDRQTCGAFPCSARTRSVAQSHQEPAHECDKDHASGSSTVGPRPECHRGLPGAAEVV